MSGDVSRYTIAEVEALEMAPGVRVAKLQGWVPELASEADLRMAMEKAFDYRGDVTLTFRDGRTVEAYIFNRRTGATLATSFVDYFTAAEEARQHASYADIARLEFTGKDCAAGKHWEDWVRKYRERKAAGETNIALHPEKLD